MHPFLSEAQALKAQLIEARRYLHTHPETGHALDQTVAYVKSRLTALGCTPQDIGDHGVVVTLGGRQGGKCILVRADMDALPMPEQSGEPFASENGAMHACGHDFHTAMLLGAAKLLKAREETLPGTVKLLFQPAEESLTGAQNMIDNGVLENPTVDAAIALHCDVASRYRPGTLTMSRAGIATSSCDRYRIEICGKGGHGATPQDAIDPINVGVHIHLALQTLLSREIPSSESVVLTQGSFHAGDAPNSIPQTAYMEGTLRCYNNELRQTVLRRMEEIVTLTARSFRAQAELQLQGGCAPVYNNPEMFEATAQFLRELVGDEGLDVDGHLSSASEDFSNFLSRVPGVFFFVTAGDSDEGYVYSMHNAKVRFDERAMPSGAAALAYIAMRWLEDAKG